MRNMLFVALLGSTTVVPAVIAQAQIAPAAPVENAVICERAYGLVEAYGVRQPALPYTLEEARGIYEAGNPEECLAMIREIEPIVVGTEFEREIEEILVLAEAEVEADVAVGAQIVVDQPEPIVTVEQPAPQVAVTQAPPQVTVRQPEPEVIVRQAPPVVRLVMPQPTITIEQAEPEIIVRMPEPEVLVRQAQPQVAVDQAQPEVAVQMAQPQVQVQQTQPQVAVEAAGQAQVRVQQAQPVVELGAVQRAEVEVIQAQPRVAFERAEPVVEVQQAGEAQVQFNQVGEPNVRFEQLGAAAVGAGAVGAVDNAVVCEGLFGFTETYGARIPNYPLALDEAARLRGAGDVDACIAYVERIRPLVVGTALEPELEAIIVE